jgi:hypothetical protein
MNSYPSGAKQIQDGHVLMHPETPPHPFAHALPLQSVAAVCAHLSRDGGHQNAQCAAP